SARCLASQTERSASQRTQGPPTPSARRALSDFTPAVSGLQVNSRRYPHQTAAPALSSWSPATARVCEPGQGPAARGDGRGVEEAAPGRAEGGGAAVDGRSFRA